MTYSSYEDYQYDSCISRGICSFDPRISALQTVLVLYLRIFAKYTIDLDVDSSIEDFLLNTISITIYNPDFNDDSFIFAVNKFQKILIPIIKEMSKSNPDKIIEQEQNKAFELFEETSEIISAIKYGEKVFNRTQENIPQKIRNLYSIMLIISKSLAINLLDLKSYDKNLPEAYKKILDLLIHINLGERNVEFLKKKIYKATKINNDLMRIIREKQEKRYGIQREVEVSFTTIPNKAVLVVGSNIRELEKILESLKNEDIDVYTHDDMMLAHTFPKFSEYTRLKGQFGFGLENCLLDFATFPGPIILTRNSLHNVENFYRGRLFTTDYISSPKGVIKIAENNYSEVIESANLSKGFKRGKQCESVLIGYDYSDVVDKISKKIETKNFDRIFIIGLDNYSLEQKAYFEKLIKLAPENVLILSFSYNIEKKNLIYINSCFDYYSIMKIFDFIREFDIETIFFIPKCERHTISQIIYLSQIENTSVYLGKCTPIILNPSLIKTLQALYNIKSITSVKKNLEEIL